MSPFPRVMLIVKTLSLSTLAVLDQDQDRVEDFQINCFARDIWVDVLMWERSIGILSGLELSLLTIIRREESSGRLLEREERTPAHTANTWTGCWGWSPGRSLAPLLITSNRLWSVTLPLGPPATNWLGQEYRQSSADRQRVVTAAPAFPVLGPGVPLASTKYILVHCNIMSRVDCRQYSPSIPYYCRLLL